MLSAISRQLLSTDSGSWSLKAVCWSLFPKQKSRTDRSGCGREINGTQLFSLPYAGITQVRFW